MTDLQTFSIPEFITPKPISEPPALENEMKAALITFIEQEFWTQNKLPSKQEIADFLEIQNLDEVNALLISIKSALDNRGLPPFKTSHYLLEKVLPPNFILYCNFAAATTDKRSNAQKLKDAGLSSSQLNAILQNPAAKTYYEQRVNSAWQGLETASKLALARNVESGDLNSIKYVMEWQGKFSPNQNSNEFNLMLVISKLMEILTQFLTPDNMNLVAAQFDEVIQAQLTKG
jgi:hypothetical protein